MELCNERRRFADEKKTFTGLNVALGDAKDREKIALEDEKNALMETNRTLEMELAEERKKSENKKER